MMREQENLLKAMQEKERFEFEEAQKKRHLREAISQGLAQSRRMKLL